MLAYVKTSENGDLDSSLANTLAIKMLTTASVIEAREEALMHEPADKLGSNSNIRCERNHLKDIPNKVHYYIQDFAHECDSECAIVHDKVETLLCNSVDDLPDHKCLTHEMVICNYCKFNVRRHCNVLSAEKIDLCIRCCQNQNTLDNLEIINVEKSAMIEEINKIYGGGHIFIIYCPLDESQSMHKEIVIEGNLNNTFDKLKCPLDTWDHTSTSGKLKAIGTFNMCSKVGSFVFKEFLCHMSQHYCNFLKLVITFDEGMSCAKFQS